MFDKSNETEQKDKSLATLGQLFEGFEQKVQLERFCKRSPNLFGLFTFDLKYFWSFCDLVVWSEMGQVWPIWRVAAAASYLLERTGHHHHHLHHHHHHLYHQHHLVMRLQCCLFLERLTQVTLGKLLSQEILPPSLGAFLVYGHHPEWF